MCHAIPYHTIAWLRTTSINYNEYLLGCCWFKLLKLTSINKKFKEKHIFMKWCARPHDRASKYSFIFKHNMWIRNIFTFIRKKTIKISKWNFSNPNLFIKLQNVVVFKPVKKPAESPAISQKSSFVWLLLFFQWIT